MLNSKTHKLTRITYAIPSHNKNSRNITIARVSSLSSSCIMYVPHIVLDTLRMTDAIDSAIKTELQQLRFRYFVGVLVSTGLVFFGLFLEFPEIAHDMWGITKRESIELKYWLTPSMERKEFKVPDWMKRWTAVGWLLIVVGVGGEGFFDGFVSWTDGTLQTFNDILLGEAQTKARDAILRATKLELDLDRERIERARLEKEIAPRDVHDRVRMIAELKTIAPLLKGKRVKLASQMFDLESLRLSIEIQAVFGQSGIETDTTDIGRLMTQSEIWGFRISGAPEDREFMLKLSESLSAHVGGLPAVYITGKPGFVSVIVGVKPIADISWPQRELLFNKQ
jgi:hypothetical protein